MKTLALKTFKVPIWRKATVILLCLLLAFGHIPAAGAALSDQMMAAIMGAGLDEASIVSEQSDSDIVDSTPDAVQEGVSNTQPSADLPLPSDEAQPVEPSQVEPVPPEMPASEVVADESAIKQALPAESTSSVDVPSEQPPITEEPPSLEDSALTDTTTPSENTLPAEQTGSISSDTEAEQTQQEQTIEIIKPIADGMVLQSTAYTCGPAALATLLKMMGGGDNYYQQITEIAQTNQTGTSMLALKQSAEALGYEAAGYKMNIEELATSGSVVAHVVIDGYHHFTVVEGIVDGFVYMADPTSGRIIVDIEQFMAAWSGAVLKVSPIAAGDAAVGGEEVPSEAPSIEDAAAPETPAVEQDPADEEPPATQPVAEPLEEPSTLQPAVEPVEDAEPDQQSVVPVADETPEETVQPDISPGLETFTAEGNEADATSAVETAEQPATDPCVAGIVEDTTALAPEAEAVVVEAPAADVAPPAYAESPANEPSPLDVSEMEQISGRGLPLVAIGLIQCGRFIAQRWVSQRIAVSVLRSGADVLSKNASQARAIANQAWGKQNVIRHGPSGHKHSPVNYSHYQPQSQSVKGHSFYGRRW